LASEIHRAQSESEPRVSSWFCVQSETLVGAGVVFQGRSVSDVE